jgi:hypothetical protein
MIRAKNFLHGNLSKPCKIDVLTAWLKPSYSKSGRDHLGVQGPCINIYGQLLPGITNVTDRARYYSFYPWFFWAFEQHYRDSTWRFITERFRRADCLFTLVAARHSKIQDEREELHGISMVGRDTLIPALDLLDKGESLKLSNYATQDTDDSNRYFKNKLGGLGQYYAGPLRELGILGGDSRNGFQYTKERGKLLADALDSGIDRAHFFNAIEEDTITGKLLDELFELCPCRLKFNANEQSVLTDLFFDRQETLGLEGKKRRKTLCLFLHLISELNQTRMPIEHLVFRKCVYSNHLPDGNKWQLPQSLQNVRESWEIFQKNELLSIALQGIFWSVLEAIKTSHDAQPWLISVESLTNWFMESRYVKSIPENIMSSDFSTFLQNAEQHIPVVEDWNNGNHELSMADHIIQRCRNKGAETSYGEIILLAFQVLANISIRDGAGRKPYGPISLPEDYLWYYPVNLNSFFYHVRNIWSAMKVKEVIAFLVSRWSVENHLRVALRKMRTDQRDTFQIRPTDDGLMWVNTPEPIYTNPRFNQGIRILWDIGLIEQTDENQRFQLTNLGKNIRGEIR